MHLTAALMKCSVYQTDTLATPRTTALHRPYLKVIFSHSVRKRTKRQTHFCLAFLDTCCCTMLNWKMQFACCSGQWTLLLEQHSNAKLKCRLVFKQIGKAGTPRLHTVFHFLQHRKKNPFTCFKVGCFFSHNSLQYGFRRKEIMFHVLFFPSWNPPIYFYDFWITSKINRNTIKP